MCCCKLIMIDSYITFDTRDGQFTYKFPVCKEYSKGTKALSVYNFSQQFSD